MARIRKPIPFAFVLDALERAQPWTRPMFGCLAVYVGDKIVLILRDKPEDRRDSGVWVATSREHHASLRREIASLRRIELFGEQESNWQNIPVDSIEFEEQVSHACALVLSGDERIGRIPKPRKKTVKRKSRKSLK